MMTQEEDCMAWVRIPMILVHIFVIVQVSWHGQWVHLLSHSWIFMVVVSADMSQAILRSLLTVSLLAVTYSVVVLALCLPILRVTRPIPMVR